MKKMAMILGMAAMFSISARGQSGFLNLNFESAYDLPGNPGNGESVSVANALPDWTAYAGPVEDGNTLSSIYYVSNSLGYHDNVELEGGSLALSGNNLSVELFGNSAISQTGVVPDNAESLQFEAEGPGPDGSLEASELSVTLGAQTLSYSEIFECTGYTVYGANIQTDMDGQTEELIFSCEGVGSGGDLLDDIEFSPESVPEPSEYALMGVGAILLGFRCRRKQTFSTPNAGCIMVRKGFNHLQKSLQNRIDERCSVRPVAGCPGFFGNCRGTAPTLHLLQRFFQD